MRDSIPLIVAIIALLVASYGAMMVNHFPLHIYEHERINNLEKWVRGRCVNAPISEVCSDLKVIKPEDYEIGLF